MPTLVKFRPFIDVISVLVEYQYYLCFCFKLFVFDVVGSWFYQTKFSKPVGHFNRELGPQFSPCTVSNILPLYPHCFTSCIKYSPRIRSLFQILYQILSLSMHVVLLAVSNILLVYAPCITYCIKYSPLVSTLFHRLYQIFSPCIHIVSHRNTVANILPVIVYLTIYYIKAVKEQHRVKELTMFSIF